jgi:anti-sigma B factor antagonist/stage II sporulation protein AA (anti-sigma F factor antagonist)
MAVDLRIELEEIEKVVVLRLFGRIDAASCIVLERKINMLMVENHKQLALDLSSISYLSSAGLRVLLSASKKIQEKKGNLVLFSLNEEVEEIMKIAGFDRLLPIFVKEHEALQFFKHD